MVHLSLALLKPILRAPYMERFFFIHPIGFEVAISTNSLPMVPLENAENYSVSAKKKKKVFITSSEESSSGSFRIWLL